MGAFFPKLKKLGREVERWYTFSVEIKNGRNYISSPSYALAEYIKATLLKLFASLICVLTLYHPVVSHPYSYG
jgi:hypothetical protein